MKKYLIIGLLLISQVCYGASEWAKIEPQGGRWAEDIDKYIQVNNEALDRLLSNYQTCFLRYLSTASLTVTAGEVVCTNSAETLRKFRRNISATTVTWSNLDVGSEGSSTQYYVYAVADADATTFTVKITSTTAPPTGVTYFKRIGSFYNNASGDMEQVSDGLKMKMVMGTGTIAHGETIPLPAGYAATECKWSVSVNSIKADYGLSEALTSCSVDASRVVTAQYVGTAGDASGVTINGTANYIIIGYRDNL